MRGVEVVVPGKPELLDVLRGDLLQRTESLLIVGAPRTHPITRLMVRGEKPRGVDGRRGLGGWRRISGVGRRRVAASRERAPKRRQCGDPERHVLPLQTIMQTDLTSVYISMATRPCSR